jgi:hypothetical protein
MWERTGEVFASRVFIAFRAGGPMEFPALHFAARFVMT